MPETVKETGDSPEKVIPPKVLGYPSHKLLLSFSKLETQSADALDSWFIRARLWGFDDFIFVPITQPNDPFPTELPIPCSLEDFFRYWEDSQFVYFELVNPSTMMPTAFSYIECQSFSHPSDTKWEHTEEVKFYNLETGCVHSTGLLVLSISQVIDY